MYRFDTTYKITQGTDLGDPTTCWDPRFRDIDGRINSCEVQFSQFQAAINDITAAGIFRVNSAMHPTLDDLAAQVAALTTQVNNLQLNTDAAWASVQQQLNDLIVEAQGLVNNLQTLAIVDGGTF